MCNNVFEWTLTLTDNTFSNKLKRQRKSLAYFTRLVFLAIMMTGGVDNTLFKQAEAEISDESVDI